jgi:hypothetical protein
VNQIQPVSKLRLLQRLLLVTVFIGAAALLGACANTGPAVTPAAPPMSLPLSTVAPGPSLSVASPGSASPVAAPTSGKPFWLPDVLLSPTDLAFNGALPASGWQRCDDYAVDRNLENFRKDYEVAESTAAVWEYGSKCGSADRTARLDEYAWQMQDTDAAVKLGGYLGDTSYFDQLGSQLQSQVREFERDSVLVRTMPVEPIGGKRQYVAEMIGQDGLKIVYLRMATAQELADEDYLGMARLSLDRLRAAGRAE